MKSRKNSRGFSLTEALIAVGVLGILSGLGAVVVTEVVSSTQKQKLSLDVETLNRSIIAYLGTGGDLSTAKTPEEVLLALKKSMKSSSRVPTLSGSKIDERLTFNVQSPDEAGGKGWRANWDGASQRFVLAQSGNSPGIKGFTLDDSIVKQDLEEEDSRSSFLYAEKGAWIWDYSEVAPVTPPGPSNMPISPIADTSPIPPPPGPGGNAVNPTNLLAPLFSLGTGAYAINSFNLPLTLSNPNPAGSSALYYSINYGNWMAYSGPLSVRPGSVVAAQAIAITDLYVNSAPAKETYTVIPENLLPPIISPSHPLIGLFNNQTIQVLISNQNSPATSRLQYRIGGDPWQDYTGPFSLSRGGYPSGALVQARAVPLETYYLSSTTTLRTIDIEKAAITGGAVGSFSNPSGASTMVTNLAGGSSDYFAWGRDYWTAAELATFNKPSDAPKLSKSWLDYDGISFSKINAGEQFEIGTLSYYNGSVVSGTGANQISFSSNLNFNLGGFAASTTFNFEFELINTVNANVASDPWPDADYVKISNSSASQLFTINGIDFKFQINFGETTPHGLATFSEFHVLENKSSTTKMYGTLIEVGPVSFNN